MKRVFLLFGLIMLANNIVAQKYFTKTGTVNFEASVPSFEEVKATNNSTTAILNIENGEIAALTLVKGFRFEIALMEEHFNESYAESNKFPKATFAGKIENFSLDSLANEPKLFALSGNLSFHGKTVKIISEALISLTNDEILLKVEFISIPEDFNIKLPKVIRKKVAETVTVSIDFKLVPKEK